MFLSWRSLRSPSTVPFTRENGRWPALPLWRRLQSRVWLSRLMSTVCPAWRICQKYLVSVIEEGWKHPKEEDRREHDGFWKHLCLWSSIGSVIPISEPPRSTVHGVSIYQYSPVALNDSLPYAFLYCYLLVFVFCFFCHLFFFLVWFCFLPCPCT